MKNYFLITLMVLGILVVWMLPGAQGLADSAPPANNATNTGKVPPNFAPNSGAKGQTNGQPSVKQTGGSPQVKPITPIQPIQAIKPRVPINPRP